MKHFFEIGSDLLCFEPDETKEKLIYSTRIINHSGFETKGKNRVPLYLVHFLGWSKKWDRVVPENLLLPLSDFNKKLKLKIDFIAKNERRHQLRHDLIDKVLDVASKVINESTFDWDELEDSLENISINFKLEKKTESLVRESSLNEVNENEKDQELNKSSHGTCEIITERENLQLQKENDTIHVSFSPKIALTDQQLNFLSLDKSINSKITYPNIMSLDDLHKHSWNPCIVDILQNYVDAFPVSDSRIPGWKEFDRLFDMEQDGFLERIENSPTSILDLTFDFNERTSVPQTPKKFKLPQWPDSELNADYQRSDLSSQLCFEVCSGLRILFDFYVRHMLLYENEWVHYNMIESLVESTSAKSKQTLNIMTGETVLKLLPEEFRNHMYGFQPSLFYGFPHLLRLLYKLPTILIRMNLTRCSLAIVLRHCYSLIKFLDISFTGNNSIIYRQFHNEKTCSDRNKSSKRKRTSYADTMIKSEPRVLLPRLMLNNIESEASSLSSQAMVTRSASKLEKVRSDTR